MERCYHVEGFVEKQFLRPVHLGSTIAPLPRPRPWLTVIPWDGKQFLHGHETEIDHYPWLAKWWRRARDVWTRHNKQDSNILLADQVNCRRSLTNQFPIAPQRRTRKPGPCRTILPRWRRPTDSFAAVMPANLAAVVSTTVSRDQQLSRRSFTARSSVDKGKAL